MCAVWSVDVIKALPFVQFGLEIYVAFIAEKLVELMAVRAVRTLHLAVELGRATFDVGMADTKILDMPVDLRLELMAVIGAYFTDVKRDLFNDMIHEVDCIGLGVPFVHLQRPHPCCVVDRRILKAADLLALFAFESQKLNIHLGMMAGHLLLVSLAMDLTHASATRKAVHPMAAQDA